MSENLPDLPDDALPEGVSADYANDGVRTALAALQATPDHEHLAAFLNATREGFLIVDVTGTTTKKRGTRVRATRSTKGQLVLPLFTSMDQLRAVAPASRRAKIKGAIMPARAALALITSDRLVAAEFDKADNGIVVLRKYVALAAGEAPVTVEDVTALR